MNSVINNGLKTTIIKFEIPFLLSIPDNKYIIQIDNIKYSLYTKQLFRKQDTGGIWNISGRAEVQYDKWGRFSYSEIAIEMNGHLKDDRKTGSCLFKMSSKATLKEKAIKILNRFIDVYRFFTKEFHVDRIAYFDIMNYEILYCVDGKIINRVFCSLDTGAGGIKLSAGPTTFKSDPFIDNINEYLQNGSKLDISKMYMLNSKEAFLVDDYRRVILESVIALEMVLSSFIRIRGKAKQIGDKDVENFIHDVGLTGNINVSLKLLLNDSEKIDDELISKCKGAITIRNKIVHKGLRDITPGDAEEKIIAIEEFISKIRSLK